MKKISTLIIAFSMFGSLYADDHKKEKREHPNKLMSAKECMETKDGIGWLIDLPILYSVTLSKMG
tara:strand:+ start:43 stop:237 length:195 start_codon:yes stop_codon:yes gene_type:complete